MANFKCDTALQLGIMFLHVILLCEGQFYGKSIPCPVSYIDPDGDCVTGIAGQDYPLYFALPKTKFQCSDHQINVIGYFADPEAHCQLFHVCLKNGQQESFLCPNGTLFNQQFLVCDWWFHVKCSEAEKFYQLNEYLQSPIRYQAGPSHPNVFPLSEEDFTPPQLAQRDLFISETTESSIVSSAQPLTPPGEINSNSTKQAEDPSNFNDIMPRTKLINKTNDPDWVKMGFREMRHKFVSSLGRTNPPVGLPRHL